jgi:hypothetical protein
MRIKDEPTDCRRLSGRIFKILSSSDTSSFCSSLACFTGVSNISDLLGGRLTSLSGELKESSSHELIHLLCGCKAGVVDINVAGVEASFAGVDWTLAIFMGESNTSFMESFSLLGVADEKFWSQVGFKDTSARDGAEQLISSFKEILLGHGSKTEETGFWRAFSASTFVPFWEKRLWKLWGKRDATIGCSSSTAVVSFSNDRRLKGSGSISSGMSSP